MHHSNTCVCLKRDIELGTSTLNVGADICVHEGRLGMEMGLEILINSRQIMILYQSSTQMQRIIIMCLYMKDQEFPGYQGYSIIYHFIFKATSKSGVVFGMTLFLFLNSLKFCESFVNYLKKCLLYDFSYFEN